MRATAGPYKNNDDVHIELTLSRGFHTFSYMDVFGDGWHGGWWEVLQCGKQVAGGDVGGVVTSSGGEQRFEVTACTR